MRVVFYIACVILLFACKGKTKTAVKDTAKTTVTDTVKKGIAEKSYPEEATKGLPLRLSDLPFDYVSTDTGYMDLGIGDGVYAVIKSKGNLIDTIDADYGMLKVDSNRYVYYKIEGYGILDGENSNPLYKNSIKAALGNYIIIDKSGAKMNVSQLAPDFNWFASPSIINGQVYYYQVKEIKNGNYRIYAANFDPNARKTKSVYLFEDYIETDDGGYFKQPYLKNGLFTFENAQGKQYKFSENFKLIN